MVDNDLEFPAIPKAFDSFVVTPNPMEVPFGLWKSELVLRNHSETAILYKIKCTSNERITILDCSDILFPGNEIPIELKKVKESNVKDQLLVLYCLVGKQWGDEDASALDAWKRVKEREIPTKSILIPIKEKKKK